MMSYGDKWPSAIFRDKKKWKFNELNGYKFYLYDSRNYIRSFIGRQ